MGSLKNLGLSGSEVSMLRMVGALHESCMRPYESELSYLYYLFLTPTNMNLAVYGNGLELCSNDVMNHVDYVIKRDVYP